MHAPTTEVILLGHTCDRGLCTSTPFNVYSGPHLLESLLTVTVHTIFTLSNLHTHIHNAWPTTKGWCNLIRVLQHTNISVYANSPQAIYSTCTYCSHQHPSYFVNMHAWRLGEDGWMWSGHSACKQFSVFTEAHSETVLLLLTLYHGCGVGCNNTVSHINLTCVQSEWQCQYMLCQYRCFSLERVRVAILF